MALFEARIRSWLAALEVPAQAPALAAVIIAHFSQQCLPLTVHTTTGGGPCVYYIILNKYLLQHPKAQLSTDRCSSNSLKWLEAEAAAPTLNYRPTKTDTVRPPFLPPHTLLLRSFWAATSLK